MTGYDDDAISILTTDHRTVEEMFTELEKLRGSGDEEQLRTVTEMMIIELVTHAVAEESYLYPMTRRFVPEGDGVADKEVAEHSAAEALMRELERAGTAGPRFDELLDRLTAVIREHVKDEERELFPRLAQNTDPAELRLLGVRIRAIKKIATSPTAREPLAPGVSRVDHVRDLAAGGGARR